MDGERPSDGGVRLASSQGRWIVAVTVLGSNIVFLDATVTNVALPAIGRDLGAGVASLQWTVNGYLLALAALILIGGSLGDRFGRRRVFWIGTVWFALASLLCAVAPSAELLVVARIIQGAGGALLTPGSLAIIESTFHPDDRGRAIGLWSGLAGVSTVLGPMLGGYLIDALSWRAIFYINVPIGVAVVALALRYVPESRGREGTRGLDPAGALLAATGLGAVSFALIEAPEFGATSVAVLAAAGVGAAALVAFTVVERRVSDPMLPFAIFRSRAFSAANAVTFIVYAALGGIFFYLGLFLQTGLGYSPFEAGAAGVPVTALMLVFSARAGGLAQRVGARPLLTTGALVMAVATLMMRSIEPGDGYVAGVLPSIVVFGLGLVLVVAPVTATALSSAPSEHAGIASAVNNAVSRTGMLFAIALLPVASGLAGEEYRDPAAITDAFHTAALINAGMMALGGIVAWSMIEPGVLRRDVSAAAAET